MAIYAPVLAEQLVTSIIFYFILFYFELKLEFFDTVGMLQKVKNIVSWFYYYRFMSNGPLSIASVQLPKI